MAKSDDRLADDQPSTERSTGKRPVLGLVALMVPLFALLAASIWFAARTWFSISDVPVPGFAYFYMALGVVFSLIVGCGLMALVFYSSRHGYDDQTGYDAQTGFSEPTGRDTHPTDRTGG